MYGSIKGLQGDDKPQVQKGGYLWRQVGHGEVGGGDSTDLPQVPQLVPGLGSENAGYQEPALIC